jgi:PhzF family phenazine biosynthesis protein
VAPSPLVWVDAFTASAFGGNPAAVCLVQAEPTVAAMQSLAAELGLSETAYVTASPPAPDDDTAHFALRWFTPSTEVELCGHATLAAAHVLWSDGGVAPGRPIEFATRSGPLRAARRQALIELDLPAQRPVPVALPEVLHPLLGPSAPAVQAGFTLLVELEGEGAVRRLEPGRPVLDRLDADILIVTARAETVAADFVVRVFAPRLGIDEDPVTGSAQCLAAPYWAGRLGRTELRCRQVSRRGGDLVARVLGPRVLVGGEAVTVRRGEVDLGP